MTKTALLPTEIIQKFSYILTGTITVDEAETAMKRAERKLQEIIKREGDAGGARREPWFFEELLKESLTENRMAMFTRAITNIYRSQDD